MLLGEYSVRTGKKKTPQQKNRGSDPAPAGSRPDPRPFSALATDPPVRLAGFKATEARDGGGEVSAYVCVCV